MGQTCRWAGPPAGARRPGPFLTVQAGTPPLKSVAHARRVVESIHQKGVSGSPCLHRSRRQRDGGQFQEAIVSGLAAAWFLEVLEKFYGRPIVLPNESTDALTFPKDGHSLLPGGRCSNPPVTMRKARQPLRTGSLQPCSSQSLCSSPPRSGGSSEFSSPGPTSLVLALWRGGGPLDSGPPCPRRRRNSDPVRSAHSGFTASSSGHCRSERTQHLV